MVLQMIYLLPQHKNKKKKKYKDRLCYDDHSLRLELRCVGGIIQVQQADLPHFFVMQFSKGSGRPALIDKGIFFPALPQSSLAGCFLTAGSGCMSRVSKLQPAVQYQHRSTLRSTLSLPVCGNSSWSMDMLSSLHPQRGRGSPQQRAGADSLICSAVISAPLLRSGFSRGRAWALWEQRQQNRCILKLCLCQREKLPSEVNSRKNQ